MSPERATLASDEDVALLVPADFPGLCPPDQVLAAGDDGTIDAADRWTLTSASVDFEAAGLAIGHVVRLVGPADKFRSPGALLGVAAVSGGSVTLRRLGLSAGEGAPVAPIGGLTSVSFVAATLEPQLRRAGEEVEHLLGLDPALPGRRLEDLADPAPLRGLTTRLVAAERFEQAALGGDGRHARRAVDLRVAVDRMLARLVLRWSNGHATRPRFQLRLTR